AVLELGRGSDDVVVARSARFVATLGKVTDRFQRPLEYADLRHQDGYAVRLRGVSTTLTPGKAASKKQETAP
ncbi:MAG: cell division protein FtsQ/DivIB, partial [Burkholderiaceae bacterium]